MRLIDAQAKLLALKQQIIQTSDAAACLKVDPTHASKILGRLGEAGVLFQLARGRWSMTRELDPLLLPEALVAPFPSYISLHSALYHHGMISQIPSVVYAVSLARAKTHRTPLGTVSIHHLQPGFFFGFDVLPGSNVKMARPEKALLDTLYLAPARSLLFKSLPEIELPKNFKINEARKMIRRIPSRRLRTIVERRFEAYSAKPPTQDM